LPDEAFRWDAMVIWEYETHGFTVGYYESSRWNGRQRKVT